MRDYTDAERRRDEMFERLSVVTDGLQKQLRMYGRNIDDGQLRALLWESEIARNQRRKENECEQKSRLAAKATRKLA